MSERGGRTTDYKNRAKIVFTRIGFITLGFSLYIFKIFSICLSLQNLLPRRILVTWATVLVVMAQASQANKHSQCTLDILKETAKNACDHLSDKIRNDLRDPFHRGKESLGFHANHHGKQVFIIINNTYLRIVSHRRLQRPIVDESRKKRLPCEFSGNGKSRPCECAYIITIINIELQSIN